MNNTSVNISNGSDDILSLSALLAYRAELQPNDKAYGFYSVDGQETQSLTYSELHQRAIHLGLQLQTKAELGDRALLIFPAGLEFLVAYFACLHVGIIPIPVIPSRRGKTRDSTYSIINDAQPSIALTSAEMLTPLTVELNDDLYVKRIQWLAVTIDEPLGSVSGHNAPFLSSRDDLAFLQYTSGSTSSPKGVMVTHGNLLDNSEMIRKALNNNHSCHYVSWVPLYHDMGLIYNVLQTLYLGSSCVLLAPVTFLQRPLLWLKAIGHYKAKVAGGPNFAFDLCVERFNPALMEGVDLSQWEVALNGAEPVRAETIKAFEKTFAPYGFSSDAFYPCYGMAEATLLVSAGERLSPAKIKTVSRVGLQQKVEKPPIDENDEQEVVGCGQSLVGELIVIAKPDTKEECSAGHIGEIWVQGGNIAKGYWQNPDATKDTFLATLSKKTAEGLSDNFERGHFLRTGDLGYLDESGELFVVGRLKDLIIVRGENFYPQDIEKTVEGAHDALKPNCCAAFTIEKNQQKPPQLVVVQEVKRTHRKKLDVDDIVACIRQAVVREHELNVSKVLLIRTGTIPKTSSGKIQRALSREKMLQNEFEVWGES